MSLRHVVSVAVVACAFAAPGHAQDAVKGLLDKASDSALDKLSKPGAFSADAAIRIAMPGVGKNLGGLMKLTDKAGLTNDISASLNRAAEQAAAEAKPIFRSAIDKMSLQDLGQIATGGKTAATEYLKKSSSGDIIRKLTPLVHSALEKSGVFKQTQTLSSVGYDEKKITDYVSQKTSDGIFTYMGREEEKARGNPLGTGKAILKGLGG
ncbi:DUF4197 domain-containing protein [Piscinibacter koreensis]|uniref:DUF4197 domain-containing protein n=1 Tax=Piscinibacter koreensis TaxID=2742824 RepID=A0A7Y6NK37_9BURK|nr:DUF4197 domain-containing protein [Schlegelella koreensis]NUZ04648.1 DUF4197 domain-containing protein [Schlegelella koreensis]